MRTLHVGLRVTDRDRSLDFYRALGYELVGEVPDTPLGHLSMLKLPGDEFVTVELVHDPTLVEIQPGKGLSHLVVQVDSMDAALERLAAGGQDVAPLTSPGGSTEILTAWVTDPDGNRIELVRWPDGHAAGMTSDDFG